jgi:hypothetical protein
MTTLTGPITGDGALASVLIGVSEARRQVLLRLGLPVPVPSVVRAVLDTGSFITLADSQAVTSLGVTAYDRRKFLTSATGATPHVRNVYDLSVTLLDDDGKQLAYWPSIDVLPAVFPSTDSVHGVLGRNLLATTALHFDGKAGTFTLIV